MRQKHGLLATAAVGALLVVRAIAQEDSRMIITRRGAEASTPGPAETFTGTVPVATPLFPLREPSRVSAASVTFEPGARSAWHAHPAGQTLVVTAGTGWIQQERGEKKVVKAGDVIWTPPGVRHWHGATPTERMTHIAIQETVDGTPVRWMEKVSEEEYRK